MAIITGGIIEEWGQPRQTLREVMQQVRRFRPRESDQNYAVDIAFRSWDPRQLPRAEREATSGRRSPRRPR